MDDPQNSDPQTQKLLENHNKICGEVVPRIVKSVEEANGKPSDTIILLMSVIVGTICAIFHPEFYEEAVTQLFEGAKRRLAEIKAKKIN